MKTNELAREIEQIAASYLHRPPEELPALMEWEWSAVRGADEVPMRAGEGYWVRVRDRLVKQLRQNRVAESVTVGMAVMQAMDFMSSHGVDLEAYRVPIGILVAMVMQALLGSENDDGPRR